MLAQKALQDKNVHAMIIFGLSVKIGVFPSKVPVSGLKIRRQCCFATFGSFLAILGNRHLNVCRGMPRNLAWKTGQKRLKNVVFKGFFADFSTKSFVFSRVAAECRGIL